MEARADDMRERVMRSEYMEWVKRRPDTKHNLVSSDLEYLPLKELNIDLSKLEIFGGGGYGYGPLIEALARKAGVSPDCIAPSVGTSLANHIAFAALIRPGDDVLLEHPVYELILSTLGFLGASIRFLPRREERGYDVDLDEIRSLLTPATKLVVLTNLHNPTSAYLPPDTIRSIASLAAPTGATVVVDEVYLDAMFEEKPPSAFHLGRNIVTTNSLTKVYGLSGLRCGWITAQPETAERIRRLTDLYHSTPPHLSDLVSVEALARIGMLTERSRRLLETNSQLLKNFLSSAKGISCPPHNRGIVAFPRFLAGNADDFCEFAAREFETSVAPGRFFGMPDHFRIAIGKESGVLEEALAHLREALEAYGQRRAARG